MPAALITSGAASTFPLHGLRHRAGPLGIVILLHITCFYLLQNGLTRKAPPEVAPREVIATFITPDPALESRPPTPEPPKPQPAPPKPKAPPVVRKTVTPSKPVPPVVDATPSPQAPPAPSAPADPAPAPSSAPSTPAPAVAAPSAPSAPAASAAPALPKTITSGIEYLRRPILDYPAVSRRMSEEGMVTLRVLVNEKGQPERAEIQKSSGYARLDEAGRKAVLAALFKPYNENGKAMPAFVIVPFNFKLQN